MLTFFYCLTIALLNCARGRKLFDETKSTFITRLVSTFGMALATGFLTFHDYRLFDFTVLWTWASLMLWCSFAWMALLSATIGSDPNHSRLWGLGHLAMRMSLAAPCIIGLAFLTGHLENAWMAIFTPLLAVPYYAWGRIFSKWTTYNRFTIAFSELCVGYGLGFIISQVT